MPKLLFVARDATEKTRALLRRLREENVTTSWDGHSTLWIARRLRELSAEVAAADRITDPPVAAYLAPINGRPGYVFSPVRTARACRQIALGAQADLIGRGLPLSAMFGARVYYHRAGPVRPRRVVTAGTEVVLRRARAGWVLQHACLVELHHKQPARMDYALDSDQIGLITDVALRNIVEARNGETL